MAVPRKRLTKRRIKNRRSQAHGKFKPIKSAVCSNCNQPVMPHRVCMKCGFYKGKKILNILV